MSFESYKPDLFPRLSHVGAFLGKLVAQVQYAPERHSDHYRGAEELLDGQLELPIEARHG